MWGVRLIRFEEPQPSRMIGLAWRSSSPRKDDFRQFGELVAELAPIGGIESDFN